MQAEGSNQISACRGNSEAQLQCFDTLTSKIPSFERNRWDMRGGEIGREKNEGVGKMKE